jgi:hypothetical protein
MSVKVTKRTPKLDKAQQLMREMAGNWRIVPRCSEDSKDKLRWLEARDRPFLRVTQSMEQSCVRFVRAQLSYEPSSNARKVLQAAADGAKAQVLLRFERQGVDVRLRPLTARYLARKVRLRLDRRIGIATRALLTDLGACKWTIER